MPGTLFVVATPIGNLEDVTARALRVLREVAIIAAEDTRRTAHLLAHYGIITPTTSLHEHNERRKTPALVARLRRGDSVALVSDAGTPTLSDPGERFIRAAVDEGIPVVSVPGPSAAVAALAASGFGGDAFTFLGFPPLKSSARAAWFEDLRRAGHPVVFFESPQRIRQTLEQLLRYTGDRPILVARELTKRHEELVRGPITSVLQRVAQPRGEYTVVIDVGHMANSGRPEPASDDQLALEFDQLVESGRSTRRAAIAEIGRRHGRSPNEVYEAIERTKKSVK
jgi:16S rRNA (cytidine1402-2'-O)-methyltransferase